MSRKDLLADINVGDPLTADMLTRIVRAVNQNTDAVAAPRQKDSSNELNETASIGDEVFSSTDGTETTVELTDSNSDTHDIERVDSIEFTEDTSGRKMTFNITYPL